MEPYVFLVRGQGSEQGTLGRWIAPGFSCWALELPWRDNRRNRSRIPPPPVGDHYWLDWIQPRRPFSGFRELYWIHDVEGRTGILEHPGNFAGDVELGYRTDSWGCVVLGLKWGRIGGQLAVLNSRTAVRLFHETMQRRRARLVILEGRR